MHRTWNIGTYYGLNQKSIQGPCVEEGGGRRKEKYGPLIRYGPMRPPLLIGIKWECKDMGMGYIGHVMGIS